MFRQRQQQQKMTSDEAITPAEGNFIARVGSLPMVTTALSQLGAIYGQTKERNRLVRYTLETAESSLRAFGTTAMAMPIMNIVPIGALDSFACEQLGKLETSYPIIAKPTDQVLEDTRKLYATKVAPTIAYVGAVAFYGAQSYAGLKHFGLDKLSGVALYGLGKVAAAKDYGMGKVSTGCSVANSVIDGTEFYVDQYLPPVKASVPPDHADRVPSPYPLVRIGRLSDKVRVRMLERALRALGRDDLGLVALSAALLAASRRSATAGRARVVDIWRQVNECDGADATAAGATASVATSTFEQKAIATARHLAAKLRTTYSALHKQLDLFPESVHGRIAQTKAFADDLYRTFTTVDTLRDLPQAVLCRAVVTVVYINDTAALLTDSLLDSRPISWLLPDFEVADIQLIDDDAASDNDPVLYIPHGGSGGVNGAVN